MRSYRLCNPSWLFCCLLVCMIAHECADAQKKKIPKKLPVAVISAFQKTYPKAKIYGVDVLQKDSLVYYEIESRDGAVYRNILYTADGKIFEMRQSVPPKSMPEAIKAALDKRFKRYTIQSARTIIRDTTFVGYTVKLASGKKNYTVSVDSSNAIVQVKEAKRESDY